MEQDVRETETESYKKHLRKQNDNFKSLYNGMMEDAIEHAEK